MRNKKWMSLLLVFVMTLCLAACGSEAKEDDEKDKKSDKTLYEHGLDVIELMVEATRDEKYMQIYGATKEIQEILGEIGEGNFDKPDKVFAVKGDMEVLESLVGIEDVEEMSEALQKNLHNRMFSALTTQLNARAGVEALAATSVCTMGKNFVDETLEDNIMYVYVYENGTPVAVTFVPGEDGAISASGCFVMYERLFEEADDLEEIWEGFGVEVEEIEVQ